MQIHPAGWVSPARALGARTGAEAAATSATATAGLRHLPAAATARASDGNRARRLGRPNRGGWGGACSAEGRGPGRGAGPGLRRERVLAREGAGSENGRGRAKARTGTALGEEGRGLGKGAESGKTSRRGSEGREIGGPGKGRGAWSTKGRVQIGGGAYLGGAGRRQPVLVRE